LAVVRGLEDRTVAGTGEGKGGDMVERVVEVFK